MERLSFFKIVVCFWLIPAIRYGNPLALSFGFCDIGAGYNLFKRKPNLQLIRVGWAVMPLAATWMALSTNLNKLEEEEEKGTKKYVYSWVMVGIFLIAYLILVR